MSIHILDNVKYLDNISIKTYKMHKNIKSEKIFLTNNGNFDMIQINKNYTRLRNETHITIIYATARAKKPISE